MNAHRLTSSLFWASPRLLFRGRKFSRVWMGLYVTQCVWVAARLCLPGLRWPASEWPEGLLIILAAAAALSCLKRELPGQSVVLAVSIFLLVPSVFAALKAATGTRFTDVIFDGRGHPFSFGRLPWAVTLLWLAFLVGSRGTARLMLGRWRKERYYGFWVLGLTATLVVLLFWGLDSVAMGPRAYERWGALSLRVRWYRATWANSLAWAGCSLFTLVLATPALISKSPRALPPNYSPLVLWLGLNLLVLTGAAAQHYWPAAVLSCGQLLLGFLLAFRRPSAGAAEGHPLS